MSIIFFAAHKIGVGHLSRALGIAGALRDRMFDLPILFLTGSSATRLLDESPFSYHPLPAWPTKHTDRHWRQVRRAVEAAQPRLAVHDTGVHPDLHALAQEFGCRQVLVQRERGDLIRYYSQHRPLIEGMDLIVFPHTREEVPELHLPWLDEARIVFSGPILRRSRRDINLPAIRKAYDITPERFTIVISNGGGSPIPRRADDGFLPKTYAALQTIADMLPTCQIIVITGLLALPAPTIPDLPTVQWLARDFEPHLLDLFAAANLVIARGGYNTVLELEQVGVPAICIPAERGTESQAHRIRRAATRSANIHPATLDIPAIVTAIREVLEEPRWEYLDDGRPDEVAANKLRLADRLLELYGSNPD
jgi:predicted glycosyltransferase